MSVYHHHLGSNALLLRSLPSLTPLLPLRRLLIPPVLPWAPLSLLLSAVANPVRRRSLSRDRLGIDNSSLNVVHRLLPLFQPLLEQLPFG